jgi:GNAT superfamily N-acetyltransferase
MLHLDTTLPTGDRVRVVPLTRGDEDTVQRVFDAMSPESRYYRFLQAMPRLPGGMRRLLAGADGERHRAAAAWHDDRPVGIVRLVTDRDGDVELSVAVIDAYHGRGLGRTLVAAALETARTMGREPMVLVHGQNHRALGLFRSHGFRFTIDGWALVGRIAPDRQGVAA